MNIVLWGFVILLFLTTVEYRIDLGSFSFAIVEPFAMAYAAMVLLPRIVRREGIAWRNPYFLLFGVITLWAILIRPFSPDWRHGLSDIRDWLIPTAVLLALLNVRKPTANLFHVGFVLVVLLLSVVGIYQYLTDSFRPFIHAGTVFKPDLTGANPGSFAVAFFSAPNGFALFLAAGILICLGWLRTHGLRFGAFRYLVLLLPLLALYLTFSRTSLLVVAVLFIGILLHTVTKSTRTFGQLLVTGVLGGVLLFVTALEILPHDPLRTFWWRIALWEIAGITLENHPAIWVLGNGIDRFIPLSFYPQPHNQTVFMLLEYGLLGVFVLAGIVGWTIYSGLRARGSGYFATNPALLFVWFALCGQFLITLTETNWIGVTGRLLFVCMVAFYVAELEEASPRLNQLPAVTLPRIKTDAPYVARERHS